METTKPIRHRQLIEYCSFQENKKLIVKDFLREYTRRTELIWCNIEGQPSQLMLSYPNPHGPVMSPTFVTYLKLFLGQACISLTVFSVHSVNGALSWKGKV